MKVISRRRILQLGAVAMGGALVASRVAQPFNLLPNQTGQALRSVPLLPARQPEPGLVVAELEAIEAVVAVAGVTAKLKTYNKMFPGPLVRVQEGDLLRLRFINRLANIHTNLHFHGLHISPNVDDPFLHGHPGDMAHYEFELPKGSAGTYWYHPHAHGEVAQQLFSGLAGAIVVAGPADELPELKAAEEHLLILKDVTLAGVEVAAHLPFDVAGKEGNLVMVNGALQPVLQAVKGTLRLRFVNTSTARYYNLNLEGHAMHLIATDGGFIETPVALKGLSLAPGERAEVLVQLERPGRFRLLDGANELMTLVAPARPEPTPLPARLVEVEKLDLSQVKTTRQVIFNRAGLGEFRINGQRFDPARTDIQAHLGDLEVWEIKNTLGNEHPFHLHTYPFQVLSRNGIAEPFRAWKDTVNLNGNESVKIVVPFRNFTGRTVFHCHIAEHENSGMMGVLEVVA